MKDFRKDFTCESVSFHLSSARWCTCKKNKTMHFLTSIRHVGAMLVLLFRKTFCYSMEYIHKYTHIYLCLYVIPYTGIGLATLPVKVIAFMHQLWKHFCGRINIFQVHLAAWALKKQTNIKNIAKRQLGKWDNKRRTWTAEDHRNPRGMSADVYGLVLFGEGLRFKESILTGQTEHRIVFAWSMNPVGSNLNDFTPLTVKIRENKSKNSLVRLRAKLERGL